MTTPLEECADYITALIECKRAETITDMLESAAFVYLSRRERIAAAWRILKTVLW